MRISAKADYAVRAAVELASSGDEPVKGEKLAQAQDIPAAVSRAHPARAQARAARPRPPRRPRRLLARQAARGDHARDVIRAVEGPLANIQDLAPEATKYPGDAEHLRDVWIAVRASLRRVLERVTIADLRDGEIPEEVLELTQDEGAWVTR